MSDDLHGLSDVESRLKAVDRDIEELCEHQSVQNDPYEYPVEFYDLCEERSELLARLYELKGGK